MSPGTCPPLTVPADGSISYSMDPDDNNEYLSGTLATFSCNEGFEIFGESTRMCQHNMTWTKSQPSCQGALIIVEKNCILNVKTVVYLLLFLFPTVVCPALEDIDFGTLTYSSDANGNGRYSISTIASYECDTNYRRIGMESRVCEGDMEWSGIAPVCERESA